MAKNRNHELNDALMKLKQYVAPEGHLIVSAIEARGWLVDTIDDKAIFDDDAKFISNALALDHSSHFFVVSVFDLFHEELPRTFPFTSNAEGVEKFQDEQWFELNLSDCIMFSPTLKGFILRPGVVADTYIVGEKEFVLTAIGQ